MAQSDYSVANASGAGVRGDINSVFSAILTSNSGATAPTTVLSGTTWHSATDDIYRRRNTANTAWHTLFDEKSIDLLTAKTTMADADAFTILDSASSNVAKKTLWSSIKTTLKTYFDTLYVALSGNQTISGVKTFGSFPVTPSSAPTTDYQASNKKYVDDNKRAIASTAQAQAGADDATVISPLKLAEALQGANQSLASTGYQKLPGGFILQWGNYIMASALSGTVTTITFPIAFPTNCVNLDLTLNILLSGGNLTANSTFIVSAKNTTSVTFTRTNDGNVSTAKDVFYFAIGY